MFNNPKNTRNIVSYTHLSDVIVTIKVGDITEEVADAIINSANIYLQVGSGVCGAIFKAAGVELKKACLEQIEQLGRNLRAGEAVITHGCNLKSNHIIHSVTPRCMFRWDETIEKGFRDTYNNIFEIAKREGFESIAIPALGIGHHYCDVDKCTVIAMEELFKCIYQSDSKIKEIRFILSDEQLADKYVEVLTDCLQRDYKSENIL